MRAGLRTVRDSFRRQKPLVRAIIAFTVLTGAAMFVVGITEDEYRLRETGVMLSIVLPVIGLLEDRIYRKSRERYLETKAAAERQKLGLPSVGTRREEQTPAAFVLSARPPLAPSNDVSPWVRPMAASPEAKTDSNAIDWYGLYG